MNGGINLSSLQMCSVLSLCIAIRFKAHIFLMYLQYLRDVKKSNTNRDSQKTEGHSVIITALFDLALP